MKCKYPEYVDRRKGAALRPCGQCLPCRINERRVKTHRIMLESFMWTQNAFITLTFSDENFPDRGVSVSEHQSFMKDFRTACVKYKFPPVRYFMCGEYGEKTFRPHYHYAMFNFPTCCGTGAKWINRVYHPCNCRNCSFVASVWKKGNVFLGTLTPDSASYVAGYVTKKMTKSDDVRLSGVVHPITGELLTFNPEFSKASTNPGLGAGAVSALLAAGRKVEDSLWHAPQGIFVPREGQSFKGGKLLPVGRYMKGKLGVEKKSQARLETEQVRSLYNSVKVTSSFSSVDFTGCNFANHMALVNSQPSLVLTQRHNRKESGYEI